MMRYPSIRPNHLWLSVIHPEHVTGQLLQFAAVVRRVEHGLARRAEIRKRLAASGQCLLLSAMVDVYADTARHNTRHNHSEDNRPSPSAGHGRLFNVLIIHMRHTPTNQRQSTLSSFPRPFYDLEDGNILNGHPAQTNESGSGRHIDSPQACPDDPMSTTSSRPRSRARSMAMSTKSTGRRRLSAICRAVNPAETSSATHATISSE